jgi:hypothetical protein
MDRNRSPEFALMFTPHTIKSFSLSNAWDQLPQFLMHQSAIKELRINSHNMEQVNIFNGLQLDTLTITNGDRNQEFNENFVAQMLIRHPEMKKVNFEFFGSGFYDLATSRGLINAYCQSANLQYLELCVDQANFNEVRQISRLRQLKKVVFIISKLSKQNLTQLSMIRLESVEKVKIIDVTHRQLKGESFYQSAGRSWPSLKHLKIDIPSNFDKGVDLLNVFLDCFPKLESLRVISGYNDYYDTSDEEEIEAGDDENAIKFNDHFQLYPNLKKLKIKNAKLLNFEDLLAAVPNLESLNLGYSHNINYTPRCLHALAIHPKLKKIIGKFYEQSNSSRFSDQEANMLKMTCKRLKSFSITIGGGVDFQASLRAKIVSCGYVKMSFYASYSSPQTTFKNVEY